MRTWIGVSLAAICSTVAWGAHAEPPEIEATTPPTARFEDSGPEPEQAEAVAEDSRSEADAVATDDTFVPRQDEWVPLSNSTDYRAALDRPWPPDDSGEPERRWYGWQTLLVDALSIGFAVATAGRGGELGLGVYVFGAPVVHAAHGHPGKALGSFGLRLGAPFVGAFIGSSGADCSGPDREDFCGLGEALEGALIGASFAIAVDAIVIANEDVEKKPPTERGVQLSPSVSVTRDRRMLLLGGSF